jgi:hypothetical protein
MGSWGAGSFQNDGALDWLAELNADGIRAVRKALTFVANAPPRSLLDVDDGCFAIAAAEVVAAARGHAARYLPDEVHEFLDEHADSITARDAALAVKAVDRVSTDPNSELRALRASPVVSELWSIAVANLFERLRAKPGSWVLTGRRAAKDVAPPPRREVRSPDDEWLVASATAVGDDVNVRIDRSGGGSVFQARKCPLDAITLRWLDADTLLITYPRDVIVDRKDATAFLAGRTIRCCYLARRR